MHPNSQLNTGNLWDLGDRFYHDLFRDPLERFKRDPLFQEGKYVVRNVEFKNFVDF